MKLFSRWAVAFLLIATFVSPSIAHAEDIGGALWRHPTKSWVLTVAASETGQRIVMGSRDNSLHVLDRQGQPVWSFAAANSITGVGVSSNGKWVVAASVDRNIYLFDATGNVLWKAAVPFPFNNAAISDDGSLVAGTADDQTLYVYDQQGHRLWTNVAGDQIKAVAIYGTGPRARVVTGGIDASIHIFSRTGQVLLQAALDHDIESLATTPNGARIVVATSNRDVQLLDGSNARVLWKYHAADDLHSVAIAGDGKTVVVGIRDGTALLLDGGGKLVETLHPGAEVLSVAVSRDGSTIVLGTADNSAVAIDRRANLAALTQAQSTQRESLDLAIAVVVAVLVGCGLFFRFTGRGRQFSAETTADFTLLLSEIWKHRLSYMLLIPTFALLLTFNYYPAVSALYHSFTDWEPGIRTTWVGFANFSDLGHDPYFLASVVNIAILALTTLAKTFTVPLIVAEMIFAVTNPRAQYWWRTAYVIPLVVPGVALILVWRNILDPNIGLLNEFLKTAGFDNLTRAWLGDPGTALGSIIFIGFPWATAFPILIFYGGLISIPGELFDSVRVDGASFWRRFWNVDVPLLMSQIKLLLILGVIGAFETFELVFLTTGGGPGSSTYTPALELYYSAMQFNRMGLASAVGLLIFIVALLGTVLTMRFIRPATEYEA